ncbi:hypothetical protein [Herbidospora sp. RD11066]
MSGLDFFADLVTTGTILGLDHTSTLEEVEAVFGAGPVDEEPHRMRHDFGLVEFSWFRRRTHDDWTCSLIGAQPHRLPDLAGEIDPALAGRYGAFPPRLDLDDLSRAVEARGFTLTQQPRLNLDRVEYREPTTGVEVQAIPESGRVVGLHASGIRPVHFARGEMRRFRGWSDYLMTLRRPGMTVWLRKREPDTEPDRTEWWTRLRRAISHRTGGTPEEAAAWMRLGLTLDELALERGIDSPDEAALTMITKLDEAEQKGLDGAGWLPTADEAVARWLAASPAIDEARRVSGDWAALTPGEIRLARRLRNQIHILRSALPLLTSADLATEVRTWDDLKPTLLRPGA